MQLCTVCYFLTRSCDRRLVRDIKEVAGEEWIPTGKLLVCDVPLKGCKVGTNVYVLRWKVRTSQESWIRDFRNKLRIKGGTTDGIKDPRGILKQRLLETTDIVCSWTKGPPKHKTLWICHDTPNAWNEWMIEKTVLSMDMVAVKEKYLDLQCLS